MSRVLSIVTLCGFLGVGLAGVAMANGALDGDAPAIMVSPGVIVLAKVDTVTVHTNVLAGDVASGSLTLNGVSPTRVYADSLGHIVAKFAVADLGLAPGEVSLMLDGVYDDDGTFSASDVVTVK